MLKLDVHRVKAQISGPPKKGQSFGIISNQVLWEFQVQVRKNMAANFFEFIGIGSLSNCHFWALNMEVFASLNIHSRSVKMDGHKWGYLNTITDTVNGKMAISFLPSPTGRTKSVMPSPARCQARVVCGSSTCRRQCDVDGEHLQPTEHPVFKETQTSTVQVSDLYAMHVFTLLQMEESRSFSSGFLGKMLGADGWGGE